MATMNASPFLHCYLYRDHTPACILSCFSTSVLYTNRTPATTAMVMRAIDRAVKDLLSTETGGGGGATMPVEKLARTQALFLFQIIRLLDGDVTLRAQGERDIRLLEVWLNDLCKVRENLRDLGAGSGTSERNSVGRRNQHPPQWEVSWDHTYRTLQSAQCSRTSHPLERARICFRDDGKGQANDLGLDTFWA